MLFEKCFSRSTLSKKSKKMLELFKVTNLFSSNLLKQIKLSDYPPVYYEEYLNNISFRNIRIRPANAVKHGHCAKSFFYWLNNLLCIFAVILFTISFFKNDEDSLYYGKLLQFSYSKCSELKKLILKATSMAILCSRTNSFLTLPPVTFSSSLSSW